MSPPHPLRNAAFRRLALSYTLNELSWAFGTVALGVLVYARTGSALATSLLFLATTFAPALVAPVLTARLDRLPVRRALPALYVTQAALFAALALATTRFWLPAVLVLALVDGAVAIVARALTRAAVAAALAPTGALAHGNKVLNVCFSIAFATGPAFAGVVVAGAGTAVSLAVACGLFATMAGLLATARALPAARGEADRCWRSRLIEGLRYVREERTIRAILAAHAASICFLSFALPIEVVYVRDSLGAGNAASASYSPRGARAPSSRRSCSRASATSPHSCSRRSRRSGWPSATSRWPSRRSSPARWSPRWSAAPAMVRTPSR